MRYVKLLKRLSPELAQIPEPEIAAPDDVKIRVRYAPVNADDYHIYLGTFSSRYANNGLGHEFSGEIVELGREAELMGLRVGDLVSGSPFLPCGKCPSCRTGRPNICMNSGFHSLSGTFAEYIIRKDRQVVALGDGSTAEEAALYWLVMACVRCVERIGPRPGQTALILGGGSAGLILTQLLASQTRSVVAVTDPIASKRHLAMQQGATHVAHPRKENLMQWVNRITRGVGFDIIVDASDNSEALEGATAHLARGGALMLFSFYDAAKVFPVNLAEMYYKEYTLLSSFASSQSPSYRDAARVMASLKLAPLIGKVFPLAEADAALRAYGSRQFTRVLLQP